MMAADIGKTYEIVTGPPPAPIDEYADRCNQEYFELLSRAPTEAEMQSFLEHHPCLVPGHLPMASKLGAHPVWCLISQPVLPTYQYKQPDFMWLSDHSFAWIPTLIEIEKPERKVFTKKGDPTAEFTHARNQLAQWRQWFESPANVLQFFDYYGVPAELRKLKREHYQTLIFGRRSEFDASPELNALRGQLVPNDGLMSFDRLSANRSMTSAMTVKALGGGRFEAIWIPETFRLDPLSVSRLLIVDGIPEAIDRNSNMSEARREFLKGRIPYWKEWAKSSAAGLTIIGPDWE